MLFHRPELVSGAIPRVLLVWELDASPVIFVYVTSFSRAATPHSLQLVEDVRLKFFPAFRLCTAVVYLAPNQ